MEPYLGITALFIFAAVLLMIQFEVEFKNPKVQRIWVRVALSTLVGFVIWMIILFGFLR